MKILIVEDEEYSKASLVKYTLEYPRFQNAEILEAENGKEAWDLFEKYSPEIVISDIRMPLMDGLELAQHIAGSGIASAVIIVSGYAEFQYAQRAIRYGAAGYLLKPIQPQELYALFDGFQNKKTSGYPEAVSVTNGFLPNSNVLLAELLTNRRDFSADDFGEYIVELLQRYSVILVRFGTREKQDIKTADISIRQYLNSSPGIVAKCVTISRQLDAVLVKETDRNICPRILCRISSILDRLGMVYHCGVSEVMTGPENAHTAFEHAEYALHSRLLRNMQCFSYETEIIQGLYADWLDSHALQSLRKYITGGRTSKALYLVQSAFAEIRKAPGASVQSLCDTIKGIELTLSTCLAQEGGGIHIPHFELNRYETLEELQKEVETYMAEACSAAAGTGVQNEEKPEDVVEMVISYIEKNYGENLTLKDMAENIFYMNSSYLSFLLKEKTGKTFSSFLIETRMRHAYEMVRESSLSITDIAGLCGYNDVSQFIQVFKKKFGNTPYRLRKIPGEQCSAGRQKKGGEKAE